jgi:hypothetical protein
MKARIALLLTLGLSAFLATGCALVKEPSRPWAEQAEAVQGRSWTERVPPGSEAYEAAQNPLCFASLLCLLVR